MYRFDTLAAAVCIETIHTSGTNDCNDYRGHQLCIDWCGHDGGQGRIGGKIVTILWCVGVALLTAVEDFFERVTRQKRNL